MSKVFITKNLNAAQNLATEELLTRTCTEATLFLWRNADCVVIGKNQNPWRECRVAELERDGGFLARRASGGGAVFHDASNLNFSFVMPNAIYSVQRQLDVIKRAVQSFGVFVENSGRNDLVLADGGAKFSGNAFYRVRGASLHHGTLLIDTDMAKLAKYLVPSGEKLAAKGVESVRARVANLAEVCGEITVESLSRRLTRAFFEEYGEGEILPCPDLGDLRLAELSEKYLSREWRFGKTPEFTFEKTGRFVVGEVTVLPLVREGRFASVKVYTDSLDPKLAEKIERALTGAEISQAADALWKIDGELAEWAAGWSI